MQSPEALPQAQHCPQDAAGGTSGAQLAAAAGSIPVLDSQDKMEVDDRPSSGGRPAGEHGLGVTSPASQLPFTAVDVVAVLQEERQAQAALGRHVDGSLTVAALIAHRQEHLPAEMCHNGTASPT